jgi:hypothetical protein
VRSIVFLLLLVVPSLVRAQAQTPYFQQEVKYDLEVQLDDRRHQLRGHEALTYHNNSPQALTFIWFHLWPNAYRDNHTAFGQQQQQQGKAAFLFAAASQRGYIDSLAFTVNGQPARFEADPENPDVAKLLLPQPLAPGATASIATPFRVQLPAAFSRGGHVGQSYQVTQWYPKPAVLDQRGWHPMPYLDQGEFYSEFGSFDVRITLPANYTVGATGVLQNSAEISRLRQLATVTAHQQPAAGTGATLAFPASAPTTKTLRYVQDRVHDFAWFADKRFRVLHDSVTLASGRVVQSWVLFTGRDAAKWRQGLQDVNIALRRYSDWVGEYPYASATAVDGALSAGSGMEYPMVTVTQPGAILHEVGHNWFYGILGSNERDFPWLDEGVNTYEQLRADALTKPRAGLLTDFYSVKPLMRAMEIDSLPVGALGQLPYQALASRGLYQPVQGPSAGVYTATNYLATVYHQTALSLRYLAAYLGQARFDQAMHLYYTRWQFRHPYPEDMQAVFEESTGQPLGWFFTGLLTGTQPYEASLHELTTAAGAVQVRVRTTSAAPWPVPVSTLDAHYRVLETRWSPPLSQADAAGSQLSFRAEGVAAVVIDANYLTPQLTRRHSQLRLPSGLPRRARPLRLRPLLSLERWDQATINWLPVAGANTSDKFMLGAAFYNNPVALQKWHYLAVPMFSFHRGELNGLGYVRHQVLPQHLGRELIGSVTVQRFERYFKVEPSLRLVLPHRVGYGPRQQVQLAFTTVADQDCAHTNTLVTAAYTVRQADALRAWTVDLDLSRLQTSGSDHPAALLLRGAATYRRFYVPKKRVQVRLFGGRFLQNSEQSDFVLGLSGSPDYRRQTFFLDRQQVSSSLAAQYHQTDNRDGAFHAYLPVASTRWLSTLTVQVDVPRLPLAVFANVGATPESYRLAERATSQHLYYAAGLTLPLFRDYLEFYLPVAGSHYANGLPADGKDFTQHIRFVLNLNALHPLRALDDLLNK